MPYYEFFAGAGLVRLGLRADWTCVWANDINPAKKVVYEANFPDPQVFVCGDVAEVTPKSLPPNATLAWASFPCQDLSLAGWRRGMQASRSGAFWPFWNLMKSLLSEGRRPPIIVVENVVGLLTSGDFEGLCEALLALDMQFGAMVIDARLFIPQSRPRVFVVAVDRAVACDRFIDSRADLFDPRGVDGAPDANWFPSSLVSAWRSLAPEIRAAWRWWRLPEPPPLALTADELIDDEPVGVRVDSPAETQRLLEMMSPGNRQKVDEAVRQGGRRVGFLYRRTRQGKQRAEVRFDGIAGCLRTPEGGSSRQTVIIIKDGRVTSRLISGRETARLMGAPDFVLPNNYNHAYKAMGDGVAVPAVEWLSRNLLIHLGREAIANTETAESCIRSAISAPLAESIAEKWMLNRQREAVD